MQLAESYLQFLQNSAAGKSKEEQAIAVSVAANNLLGYFYGCNGSYTQINEGASVIPQSADFKQRGALVAVHMSAFFVALQMLTEEMKARDLAGEPVEQAIRDAKAPMSNKTSADERISACARFMEGVIAPVEAQVGKYEE